MLISLMFKIVRGRNRVIQLVIIYIILTLKLRESCEQCGVKIAELLIR